MPQYSDTHCTAALHFFCKKALVTCQRLLRVLIHLQQFIFLVEFMQVC